ncbi:MAG TPA: alcohol dehydrogenase catalytic domain-containing protein [Planctomycetota bacterium]|nr:alcohol dehydrogenase catalytic domain-containing protein [Planctomycetota bacterium]
MAETVRAAVLRRAGELAIEERPMPRPGQGQVAVAVEHCGVCGSDVHYFLDGRIGDMVVEAPLVLGHEFAGTIAELGEGVGGLEVGQPVAVQPGVPCGRCRLCRGGRYNLCPDVSFAATPPVDGALTDRFVTAADFVHPLPDGLTTEDGALGEPLACAVHAVERAGVRLGHRVAVLGSGPIGLMVSVACQAVGATVALATDLVPARLAMARTLGAERTLDPNATDIVAAMKGEEIDVAVDCAGALDTPQQGIDLVRRGGTVLIIGFPRGATVPLDMARAVRKELDILPMLRFVGHFPAALALLRRERGRLRRLITHRFAFGETERALRLVDSRADGVVKAMIAL